MRDHGVRHGLTGHVVEVRGQWSLRAAREHGDESRADRLGDRHVQRDGLGIDRDTTATGDLQFDDLAASELADALEQAVDGRQSGRVSSRRAGCSETNDVAEVVGGRGGGAPTVVTVATGENSDVLPTPSMAMAAMLSPTAT